MVKSFLKWGSLMLLLAVVVSACGGGKAQDLAEPGIQLEAGKVAGVTFQGREVLAEVLSFDPSLANLGNAEVWLEEGQVAELVFTFGEADGQVVVTPDPAYKTDLMLGFLDVQTLQYATAEVTPELKYVYARLEPGEVRIYIAAKNFEAAHFWVRLDVP